jgi:uncharacterized protein (TIGR03086 family)
MTSTKCALDLDRCALELLAADIAYLSDDDLTRATPCAGWSVAALLEHMSSEHAAISGTALPTDTDPRATWRLVVDDWLEFFESAEDQVWIPKMNESLPAHQVLSVHFADMVVHRWDLMKAIGAPCETPVELLDAAAPVAELVTSEASPLVGPGGVYGPALAPDRADSPLDMLVRRYGRDPHWRPPAE